MKQEERYGKIEPDQKRKYVMTGLTALAVCTAVLLIFFIFFRRKELAAGISAVMKILQPFLIGSVLAYLLAPLCSRYERWLLKPLKKLKHGEKAAAGLAVFFSAVTALAIISVLVLLIVPSTLKSIISLIMSIPDFVLKFIDWSNDKLTDYPEVKKYLLQSVDVVYDKFDTWIQEQLMPSLTTVLNGVGNSITIIIKLATNIVIGFIVSVYLLSSRKTFARQAKMLLYAMFKPKAANLIFDEVKYADKMFSGFLRGKVLDSAIVGMICFIVLKIMDFPDVMLISVIIGVTNIIPFFGPFIGAIPSALLIFVIDPKKCIYFIIFIIILQQFDGNILGPKCMGSSINLSVFWVLFAILLFGGLFGFVGMLIGVPLFAVIYDIIKKLVYYNLEKHDRMDLIFKTEDEEQPLAAQAEPAAAAKASEDGQKS
ncbi:MAG: AI-2E family transporter [Oscillospiraceae bacterium]